MLYNRLFSHFGFFPILEQASVNIHEPSSAWLRHMWRGVSCSRIIRTGAEPGWARFAVLCWLYYSFIYWANEICKPIQDLIGKICCSYLNVIFYMATWSYFCISSIYAASINLVKICWELSRYRKIYDAILYWYYWIISSIRTNSHLQNRRLYFLFVFFAKRRCVCTRCIWVAAFICLEKAPQATGEWRTWLTVISFFQLSKVTAQNQYLDEASLNQYVLIAMLCYCRCCCESKVLRHCCVE